MQCGLATFSQDFYLGPTRQVIYVQVDLNKCKYISTLPHLPRLQPRSNLVFKFREWTCYECISHAHTVINIHVCLSCDWATLSSAKNDSKYAETWVTTPCGIPTYSCNLRFTTVFDYVHLSGYLRHKMKLQTGA